jgi:tetratricopeptide (TPR) repeat protein
MEEYLLGVEAELAGSVAEAQAHYTKVLIDRPTSFWGHYRAAVVACEFHNTRSAFSHLTFCVDRRPRNPVLRDRLAGRLFELGQCDAALEQCNTALMLDPDLAESYRTRTLIRGRLGQTGDLISDIRRFELLTRSQGKVSALKLRLESMISLRDDLALHPEDRYDDLPRRILDVDFEDVDARTIVAEQLLDAGRRDWDLLGPGNREKNLALMEAALGEIDTILESDPEHLRARYERAMLLRQVERALGEIEKVLKSHPENPRAHREHAILIRLLRREEAARDLEFVMDHPRLEKFLQESHDAISVFHHSTSRYIQEGNILAALRAAERGLTHSERLNWMRGMSHYMIAKVYAVASADAPGLLRKTAFHLKKAGETRPHFIMEHFENDPTFDSLRHKIRPLID